MSLRVVLIDANDLFAAGPVDCLALRAPGIEVVHCGRLADALELAPSFEPILFCMGEDALEGSAAGLLPPLLARHGRATLLVLRGAAGLDGLREALDLLGAAGRETAAAWPAPGRDRARARGVAPAVRLSERETEIVLLLREGLSNKLIARRLDLSVSTVKTHVANLFRKIGAGNRLDAICKFAELNREAAPDPLLSLREHMLAQREAAMFRRAAA